MTKKLTAKKTSLSGDCNGLIVEFLEPRKLFSAASSLATGQLDPSFGNGTGQAAVHFSNDRTFADVKNSLTQPDGRIVIVGDVADANGGTDFAIARINPDGTPDTSFGDNGLEVLPQVGNADEAYGVALQSDGKIVVVGSFAQVVAGQTPTFDISVVARLDTNGNIDPTFADQGYIFGDFNNSASGMPQGEARAVLILADGKIVVAGGAANGFTTDQPIFACYSPNGSLDPTFGDGGKLLAPAIANPFEEIFGLALQPDGKIVGVGSSTGILGISSSLAYALRVNADGTLDRTFGSDGAELLKSPSPNSVIFGANTVAVQHNGGIVLGGFDLTYDPIRQSYSMHPVLARLLSDGLLDKTFGSRGIDEPEFGDFENLESLHILSDGRILAAGQSAPDAQGVVEGDFGAVVLQFRANGSLDTSFGQDGRTIVSFPAQDAAASLIRPLTSIAPAISRGFQPTDSAPNSSLQEQLQSFQADVATISITSGGEIQVVSEAGQFVEIAQLIGNGADLKVTLPIIKIRSVIEGSSGSIAVNVSNDGNSMMSGVVDFSVYLSTSSTIDANSNLVFQIPRFVRLPAESGKSTFRISFDYPDGIPDNNYYLVVAADCTAIHDSNPANNVAATGKTIAVAQPSVLLTSQLTARSAAQGLPVDIVLKISNDGNSDAHGKLAIQVLSSADLELDSGDTPLDNIRPLAVDLRPSDFLRLNIRIKTNAFADDGNSYILAAIDDSKIPFALQPQIIVATAANPASD